MAIYRYSIDATICFDIEAQTDEEAQEKARKYVNDDMPECYELQDDRHSCAYPTGDHKTLELENTFPAHYTPELLNVDETE